MLIKLLDEFRNRYLFSLVKNSHTPYAQPHFACGVSGVHVPTSGKLVERVSGIQTSKVKNTRKQIYAENTSTDYCGIELRVLENRPKPISLKLWPFISYINN